MKILLSWLSRCLNSPDALSNLRKQSKILEQRMPLVGLELSSRKDLSQGIEDVITAEILSFQRHPDADRLNVCEVKVSDSEKYSIVCGAPNVRQGMKVALARDGCILPGDFKIKRSKIRGVESCGMLCSAAELGLSSESEGILDLPEKTPLGKPLVEVLGLNDQVWEFELTPDRADCLSHIGLARELGRYVGASMQLPEYETLDFSGASDVPLISLEVQAKRACPFYCAQLIENFKSEESPSFIKNSLEAIGIKSKGLLVDATNYVLMELGQPLHAFDADKVEGSKIIVRYAKKGEHFVGLDEVNRELCKEDLVIADSKGPIALAGVMGSLESAVTKSTKRIILESACFSPDVIRGAVQRHKLHTDASHRFERGVDPNMAIVGAGRALKLLKEYGGARRRGSLVHFQNKTFAKRLEPHLIHFDLRAFRRVTGLELSAKEISDHLSTVEIQTEARSEKVLKVFVPTHRSDLVREIDLIEEVSRLAGFDGIPTRFPPMLSATSGITERIYDRIQKLRSRLLSTSMVEVMPYCFFSESEKQFSPNVDFVSLENPLSKEWSFLRSNLSVGLLRTLSVSASKAEYRAKFFETGNVFEKRKDPTASSVYSPTKESFHAAGIFMGQQETEHWSSDKGSVNRKAQFDFFDAKGFGEQVIELMGIYDRIWSNVQIRPLWKVIEDPNVSQVLAETASWIPLDLLHPGRTGIYFVPGKKGPLSNIIGFAGELHPSKKKELLNLPTGKDLAVAFAELRCFDDLWKIAYDKSSDTKVLKTGSIVSSSKFPFIERDLSFVVSKATDFSELSKVVFKEAGSVLVNLQCVDVYPLENDKVSISLRLTLQSRDKTLEDTEITAVITKTTEGVAKVLGASLR